jgi:hypothetical protein
LTASLALVRLVVLISIVAPRSTSTARGTIFIEEACATAHDVVIIDVYGRHSRGSPWLEAQNAMHTPVAVAVLTLALPAAAHGNDRRDDGRVGCDGGAVGRADGVGFERDVAARPRDGRRIDVEATIRQGLWSARLTPREADGLPFQLRDLEAMQRRGVAPRKTGPSR